MILVVACVAVWGLAVGLHAQRRWIPEAKARKRARIIEQMKEARTGLRVVELGMRNGFTDAEITPYWRDAYDREIGMPTRAEREAARRDQIINAQRLYVRPGRVVPVAPASEWTPIPAPPLGTANTAPPNPPEPLIPLTDLLKDMGQESRADFWLKNRYEQKPEVAATAPMAPSREAMFRIPLVATPYSSTDRWINSVYNT